MPSPPPHPVPLFFSFLVTAGVFLGGCKTEEAATEPNCGADCGQSMGGQPSMDPPDALDADDFVRADGPFLVGPDGKELRLRAINLGNWLLWEGYMWRVHPEHGRGVRQRELESKLKDVIGEKALSEFETAYAEQYISAGDMEAIAQLGFNSVRLPINARLLLPEDGEEFDESGFARLEAAIQLAKDAGLYTIVDMHAAPGGQGGKDIDDSPNYCPELFTERENQLRLIKLWKELARRFKNEPFVAGYDLLNEPIPWREQISAECRPTEEEYESSFILALWPLYQEVAQAIRAVDPNHALFVQGAHWGSDIEASVGAPFDENLVYSFHFYGTPPLQVNVQKYVLAREAWNRPIWVGEFGESTEDHFEESIKLFEANQFGWAFWSWKRLAATSPLLSYPHPEGWEELASYLEGAAPAPDPAQTVTLLEQLLKNATFESCEENPAVIAALTSWQSSAE